MTYWHELGKTHWNLIYKYNTFNISMEYLHCIRHALDWYFYYESHTKPGINQYPIWPQIFLNHRKICVRNSTRPRETCVRNMNWYHYRYHSPKIEQSFVQFLASGNICWYIYFAIFQFFAYVFTDRRFLSITST